MIHTIEFSHLIEYDTRLTGISLDVKINVGSNSSEFTAKVDTGSTNCIFARKYGEQIGLNIESGNLIEISTAIGTFKVFQHFITLSVFDSDFEAKVCFAENEYFSRSVLGRFGFLDRVLLGLNDYEGKLYLSSLAETWS